jgi:hypothetical protein
MPSQFIAFSVVRSKEALPQLQQMLSSAISEMKQASHYLTTLPSISEQLKETYFLPWNTDSRLRLYQELAEKIVINPNQSERIDASLSRRLDLLASLGCIVSQYQKEAQDSVLHQQRLQTALLLLILALILSEAFFLIPPLYRQLGVYSQLATRDTLSGCHSRGYFVQLLHSNNSDNLHRQQKLPSYYAPLNNIMRKTRNQHSRFSWRNSTPLRFR